MQDSLESEFGLADENFAESSGRGVKKYESKGNTEQSNDARYVYLLRKINEELSEGCRLTIEHGKIISRDIGRFKMTGSDSNLQILETVPKLKLFEDGRAVLASLDGKLIEVVMRKDSISGTLFKSLSKEGNERILEFKADIKDGKMEKLVFGQYPEIQGGRSKQAYLEFDDGGNFTAFKFKELGKVTNESSSVGRQVTYINSGLYHWHDGNESGGVNAFSPIDPTKSIDSNKNRKEKRLEGRMVKGEIVFGTIEYVNEKKIYRGEIAKTLPNGKGSMTFTDDQGYHCIIETCYMNGVPATSGDFKFTSRNTTLEGKLEGHVLVGNKVTFPGIDHTLTGQPVPEGITWVKKAEGSFNMAKGGVLEGFGKVIDCLGNSYEGLFENNLKKGQGKLSIKGMGVISGNFDEMGVQGKGKVDYTDGGVYEGDMVDSESDGYGVYTYADGRQLKGQWVQGAFIQETSSWSFWSLFGRSEKVNTVSSSDMLKEAPLKNQPSKDDSKTITGGGASQYIPKDKSDSTLKFCGLGHASRATAISRPFSSSTYLPWRIRLPMIRGQAVMRASRLYQAAIFFVK